MIDSSSVILILEVIAVSVVVGIAAIAFLLKTIPPSSQPVATVDIVQATDDKFAQAPIPSWVETSDGVLRDSNASYDRLADLTSGDKQPFQHPPDLTLTDGKTARYTTSIALRNTADPVWYEVTLACGEGDRMAYAVPITNQVKAESALRDFTQTLAKTFAHLPVGLVIFDSKRELVLFNPAIGDLTNLPIEFMASRPSLFAFLDRLRETQMMPEPKDYKSWRNDMAKLEAAAVDGTYSELWTLPSQVTYRVSGRPHPDGAVAFVFEDISADITLKRRFRSEIEQGHAILDCFDQGIAVFSNVGVMTFTNRGYQKLWGNDPSSAIIDTGIVDATREWQSLCRPSPIWGDLRDFILNTRDRTEWSDSIELLDGTHVVCRVVPLANGATLVRFEENRTPTLMPLHNPNGEPVEMTG
ncbi:PAS-domain containing protein [Cognatishimia sp. MH4019]|uniref:PAS-domain containing protein n=1 Tax=Cognatishimia sp. MH4019 TaxID=2854030 RepID=UPI001CD28E1B|nr:PAS-domain containing protein [Cognatishimia sp. MH4019]